MWWKNLEIGRFLHLRAEIINFQSDNTVEGIVLLKEVRKRRLVRVKSGNRATEMNDPLHRIVRLEIYDFGSEISVRSFSRSQIS
jgi:hypothetical protein